MQYNNSNNTNPILEALNQDYIRQAAIRYNENQNVQRKISQVEDATRKLKDFLDCYDRAYAS